MTHGDGDNDAQATAAMTYGDGDDDARATAAVAAMSDTRSRNIDNIFRCSFNMHFGVIFHSNFVVNSHSKFVVDSHHFSLRTA